MYSTISGVRTKSAADVQGNCGRVSTAGEDEEEEESEGIEDVNEEEEEEGEGEEGEGTTPAGLCVCTYF